MHTVSQSQLLQAATSTFEELGFLFLDPDNERDPEGVRGIMATARVDFEGAVRGSLEVGLSRELVFTLATNMLGLDVAPDEDVAADAFGEVANVICGNLLPAVAGPTAVCDLGSPQVDLSGNDRHKVPGVPVGKVVTAVEDGRAELALFLERRETSRGT